MTDETVVEEKKDAPKPPKKVKPSVSPEKAAADTKKAAKQKKDVSKSRLRTTASGYRTRLVPVAANTLREAQSRIPDALMRTYTHPNTGKEEENPAHPEYIAEQKLVVEERTKAAMNAMLLFGVELLEPIPDDNVWLKKCLFSNLVTQEQYDEAIGADGEFLRELFYKNYIVGDFKIINEVAAMSGVTEEMIAEAQESFPSKA